MSSPQPITCPRCGGPDLTEITWNRRRCNHCGTESVLSEDRTRLELIGSECAECGFNNDRGATYCGKCGAALAKICPKCLSEMRLDLAFCPKCGCDYAQQRDAVVTSLLAALDAGKKPSHWCEYVVGVLRLNPNDWEALVLLGQIRVNESKWRKGVSHWARVHGQDNTYPPVNRQLSQFVSKNLPLLMERGLVDSRIKDDRARRYLAALRSKTPPTPPALGQTSLGLLQRYWPSRAERIRKMHDVRLQEHQSQLRRVEATQAEAYDDTLALANMCVEGLEERAERRKRAEELAKQRAAQMDAKQRVLEAKRRSRDANRARAREATKQKRAAEQVVVVERQKKRSGCCCLPVALVLTIIPIVVTAGLILTQ